MKKKKKNLSIRHRITYNISRQKECNNFFTAKTLIFSQNVALRKVSIIVYIYNLYIQYMIRFILKGKKRKGKKMQ